MDRQCAAERAVLIGAALYNQIGAERSAPFFYFRLVELGAVGVIPETVEASLQLAARLLEKLDVPENIVDERIEAMRQAELKRLQGQV